MGVLLVGAGSHQPGGQVYGHAFVQSQPHVHQVMVAVNGQPSVVGFVDTEPAQVWQIAIDRRAIHADPPGNLGLAQTIGILKQKGFYLQQSFGLTGRAFHAFASNATEMLSTTIIPHQLAHSATFSRRVQDFRRPT